LAIRRFRYRRWAIAVLNALMGLPPVVVGLIVYLLLSRSGPFGVLGLLFTPTAMIIAQVIIITPLIASVTHQAMRDLWAEYHDLLISLNATPGQRILTLILDGRRALLTAALAGFGRAIGEVGAIMIVGGNIDHATRVLTTAIALETGRGDFALALGLGFVLILLALTVNLVTHALSRTEQEGRW
ncbi:ABC transporter permease, partial [Sulfitobacter sp. HI0129]